jgi:hypothetical protein
LVTKNRNVREGTGSISQIEKTVEEENICKFCKKSFKQMTTLLVHRCEPKRRDQNKNEKHVRLGFEAFRRFFEVTQNVSTPKTYEEFAKSNYYLSFVKFGQYMIDVKCPNSNSYIDWVIKSNIALDKWHKDSTYTKFLQDWVLHEDHFDAVSRSLSCMADWADDNNSVFEHYFLYASNPKIVYDINRGQVSAWVIFCSKSGQAWLEKLSPDELVMIWPMVNADKWIKMLNHKKEERQEIEAMLREAKL